MNLLSQPSITFSGIKYVGKKVNNPSKRIAGLVPSEMEYLVVEPDEWETKILPLLRTIPNHEIAEKSGLSRRPVIRLKQGENHPMKKTMEKIRLALKSGN